MLGTLKFQRDILASSFGLNLVGIVFLSNNMLHVFSQHVVSTKSEKNVNRQFLEMFKRNFRSAFVVLCVVRQ